MGLCLTKCLNKNRPSTSEKRHETIAKKESCNTREMLEELKCSTNLARVTLEDQPVSNIEKSSSGLCGIHDRQSKETQKTDILDSSNADEGQYQKANDQTCYHGNELPSVVEPNSDNLLEEVVQPEGKPRGEIDNTKEGVSQILDCISEHQNANNQNVGEGVHVEDNRNVHTIENPSRHIVYKGVMIGRIGWNHPKGVKLRTLTVSQKNMLSEFATRAASFAEYINQRCSSSSQTAHLVDEIDSVLKDIANIEVFRDFTNVRISIRRVEKAIQNCAIGIRALPITSDDLAYLSRCANWATGVVSQLSNSTPRRQIDQMYNAIINIYEEISRCTTWQEFDMININLKNVTDAINEFSNTDAALPQ